MQSRSLLMAMLVGTMWMSAMAAPKLQVGPKMLQEGGDCLGDEILAWQRLRAERRTVVERDDSPPIVCADPAGRLYLVNGAGQLLTSDDNGETFSVYEPPKTITLEGQPVKDIQAFGVLKSTAPVRPWLGQARGPLVIAYGQAGQLHIAQSEDDGASWVKAGALPTEGYAKVSADGVRMVPMADGGLLLAVGAWKESGEAEGLVFRSANGGRTWAKRGSLGPRCVGANLLQLRSGELLAAISYRGCRRENDPEVQISREELFNNVVVARSKDGGATWGDYQCLTRYREAPGDLLELADGTVVLTYGQQNFPYGARAMVSRDGGRTWDRRVCILGYSTVQLEWSSAPLPTQPGWQVTSVAARDNTLLTLYTRGSYVFAGGVAQPKGEHIPPGERGRALMSVRWTLEGMAKAPLGAPQGVNVIAKPNAEGYLDNGRCLIKPEHLQWGGDYYSYDEILRYERLPAERHVIPPAGSLVVCWDAAGNLVLAGGSGQIYRSQDNGRSWVEAGRSPRELQSFGVLQDNTLIVTYGTDHAGKRPLAVLRSADWGKTWSEHGLVDPGAFDRMGGGDARRIIELADGAALMTCGNLYLKGGVAVDRGEIVDLPWDGIYRSRDGGKTWGDFSYIGHPACETNLLRLHSGRLMAAIRFQGTRATDDFMTLDPQGYRSNFVKNTAVAFSEDNGYTWSPPRTVTRYNECPADLAEMADGTIVLNFMQKNNPNGARAMISRDQGKSWDTTQYMISWWKASGLFPSSVVLKDGRVLTASGGYSGDTGPVVEVKMWRPLGPAQTR
jgi:hypothetical protein